jgi:putative SOS response-associated peptidase YedK
VCGRFTQQRPTAELAELFGAETMVDDPGPRYNVAPTQEALVVVERDGERRLTAYRWGLVPVWAERISAGARMFNARAETAPTTPAFRDALGRRRCLVPVDGFYEWRREAGRRQPHLIRRRDGKPLALAGLWATWRDPATGAAIRSFAILTTRPNELVAALHDRMPVILPEDAWDAWLATSGGPPSGELLHLLAPCSSEVLEAFPVRPLVNDVRREGPELVERIEVAEEGSGTPDLSPDPVPTLGLV